MRCVIIPSIALSMIPDYEPYEINIFPYSIFGAFLNDLEFMCDEIISYIRHKPTNDVLEKHLPGKQIKIEAGEYIINPQDTIFIVALKKRAPKSGEDVPVDPKDLATARVVARRIVPARRTAWEVG